MNRYEIETQAVVKETFIVEADTKEEATFILGQGHPVEQIINTELEHQSKEIISIKEK